MADALEKDLRAAYDHLTPSPEVRDDVLAGLSDERASPRSLPRAAILGACLLPVLAGLAFLLSRPGTDVPAKPASPLDPPPAIARAVSEDGRWRLELQRVALEPWGQNGELATRHDQSTKSLMRQSPVSNII